MRDSNLQPKPEFSLIVPCFNEESAIRQTIEELDRVVCCNGSGELIIVDDGSRDQTPMLLEEMVQSRRFPRLTVITHHANRGYGAALKTGIRQARGDLIVITDADGSYPSERIPEMIEFAAQYAMVVGARIADDVNYSPIRNFPKVFLGRWVTWLAGVPVPDMNSGMRVMRKRELDQFLKILPDTFSFTTTITLALLSNRYPVHFVPIGYKQRIGKSKIHPIRDTLQFTQLILRTGMYFAPMRLLMPFAGLFGLLTAGSLAHDVFVLRDLTEKTLLLLVLATSTAMFALLADMIDKRTPK